MKVAPVCMFLVFDDDGGGCHRKMLACSLILQDF